MNSDFIKELVKQVMDEMSKEEEILTQETNVSGDVAGYDSPFIGTQKRKTSGDTDDDGDK